MSSPAPAAGFTLSNSETSASAAWRLLAYTLILIGVARLVGSTQNAAYRNDFAHYYLAANFLVDGKNPYVTPLEPLCAQLGLEYDKRIPTGANPPLLIAAMTAIGWLPLSVAYLIWASLQVVSLCVLLVVVRRVLGWEGGDPRSLLLAGVLLNATCLQRQFHYSQVQIYVAACLGTAVVLHIQNRRMASCTLAALAAAFKVYPAAMLPWFLLTGLSGWRDFLRRSVAVVGVGAATLAVTGVEAWRSFIVDGLPIINRSVAGSVTNYSLPSLVSTVAGELWGQPLPEGIATSSRLLRMVLAIGALGAAYLIVWRRRLEPVAAFGVLTAATMAASLVCWSHYFVLMILPVVWLGFGSAPARSAHTHGMRPIVAGALCLWPELDWWLPLAGGLPRIALHFYPLAALGAVAMMLSAAPRAASSHQGTSP